jgi:hypothetical protein
MMRRLLLFVIASILLAAPALPRSSAGHTRSTSTRRARSTKCASCARNSHGKIQRSAIAKRAFRKSNPCPSTGRTSGACSGYVVDHVKALKRGGADEPGNMQWQTTAAAKAKGRIE